MNYLIIKYLKNTSNLHHKLLKKLTFCFQNMVGGCMKNRQLIINMLATLFSFLVTIGINFILSPYIINTVGSEAYGFVGLANNFVSYGQLITLALNSMAGRFITIKIHQGDEESANKYFTSVIIANIFIAIILLVPSIGIIVNLNEIINIPQNILLDVKILWALVFLNFLIGIVLTTFNIATFVTNRLDLSSIRDIQSNILKVFILVMAFLMFRPSVWYIGLASLLCTIFIGIYNIYYKFKLLPNVKVKWKYFDLCVVWELLCSGIWNVIVKLVQILTDGLDLLIANIFIDPIAMALLSIAKTVPTAVASLLGTLTHVFTPQLTIHYAVGDREKLIQELLKSMKFCGFIVNIPLIFLIVFGYDFYQLWVPGENIVVINILAILTISSSIVQGVINPLFNVFTITNKLKFHSFIIVINGFFNTLLVIFLLKTTHFGIFAIAGISSFTAILRDLSYTPIYSSICLEVPKKTFYPVMIRYFISTLLLLMSFYMLKISVLSNTWGLLFINVVICGILGLVINYFIVLGKKERIILIEMIRENINKIPLGM